MSTAANPKDQRRAQRETVCFRCDVDPVDGPAFSGLIVNISPFGCMMRTGRDLAPGSDLRFRLPAAGPMSARVIWSMGGRVGMEFQKPFDPDPYLAMLEQLSQPGDDLGIF